MTTPPSFNRVAIVFSGGPAPAANAVISAAASAFLRAGTAVVGILHGYTGLQEYDAETRPLVEGQDYRLLQQRDLRGLRNSRGVLLGTARPIQDVRLKPLKTFVATRKPNDWPGCIALWWTSV